MTPWVENSPQKINTNNSTLENKLLSTDYAELLKANPYKNLNYKESFWQKVASALGFRTNYDAYSEAMQMQSNEYISQVAEKAYNEKYESPIAEADRLRSAGINADLQGLGDVAGASNMPQDSNPPVPPESNAEAVSKFAGFVMTAVTSAVGIAKDYNALKSVQIANESGQIGNASKVLKLAFDSFGMFEPSRDTDNQGYISSLPNYIQSNLSESLPRRYRKQFEKNTKSFLDSLPIRAKAFKDENELVDARTELSRKKGSQYFDESQEVLNSINKPIAELNDMILESSAEMQEIGNQTAIEKAGAEKEYYTKLDTKLKAKTENASNETELQSQTVDRQINSTMAKIVKNLSKLADDGNNLASVVLLMLNLMRMTNISVGAKGASIGFNQ